MKRGLESECPYCRREPDEYVPDALRPKCISRECPPDRHALVCCNGAFMERLPEFVECARQTRGMYLRSAVCGLNTRYNPQRALEMFIPLKPKQLRAFVTEGKPFFLVRRDDEYEARPIESIRVESCTKDGIITQTFDGIDQPRCTKHMKEWAYGDKVEYSDLAKSWNPTQTVQGKFHQEANGPITIKAKLYNRRFGPNNPERLQEHSFVPCVLRVASLKTLCLDAINEHRLPYDMLPEPRFHHFLWKAVDPDRNQEMLTFLDNMDRFGDVIRKK